MVARRRNNFKLKCLSLKKLHSTITQRIHGLASDRANSRGKRQPQAAEPTQISVSKPGHAGHLVLVNTTGDEMSDDLEHLRHSIALADTAVRSGNHPFGAVLVAADGSVLHEAMNTHSVDRGPGHAEANLAREAARRFDIETLRGATLYTSVEPCSMCAGTIYWAEIGAVVFGMTEARLGTLTGDDPENPTQDLDCRTIFASGRRKVEVRGPFPELEDQIAAQHAAFWKRA